MKSIVFGARFSLPVLLATGLLQAACGPAPVPVSQASQGQAASAKAPEPIEKTSSKAPSLLPDDVDLGITLSPNPAGPVVRVTVVAREKDAGEWTSAKPIRFVEPPRAEDARGALDLTVTQPGQPVRITLGRPADGVVKLTYTVRADLPAFPDPPAVAVDPDRFDGAGEALLILPSSLAEKSAQTSIRIETDEIGTAELVSAASSFGQGTKVVTVARGVDLQGGVFVAGLMGRGSFRAPEGNDDATWLGYTAFDPRPAFADMASLRTALKLTFGAADTGTLALLFVSDSRPNDTFTVTRRPRSVLTRIGVQQPWTAPLRIAVAAAVVHGWIGSRLWIGPDDPARERQAYWFTEGASRHLARDLLFRYGLITPLEAAADVEGLASILATSEAASLSNEELSKNARGALPVLVARGALYALRTASLLSKKSNQTRSLEHILRELYKAAAEKRSALPTSAWVDAVVKELGEGERAVFKNTIEEGKPADIPSDALGPCFRRVKRTYVGFDIGFDEEASKRSYPRKITGLVKGGPAEKAGLREGDILVAIRDGRRSPSEEAQIDIQEGDKIKTIKYKPVGRKGTGVGFERRRDVSDDACTP